jgi:S-adenosylmethionine decarboxylase
VDGLHLIADLAHCQPSDPNLMTNPRALERLCLSAVDRAELRSVAQLFHSFQESGEALSGVTGVVLLAESHCAIHTWPEKNAVTLDVYVCNFGQDNSNKARALMQTLCAAFSAGRVALKEVARGGASADVTDF